MTTSLTPSTQFDLLDDFRREVDGLVSRFFTGENGGELSRWTPQVNVSETDEQYEISIDLPEMKPDDFNVHLRHGDLWITGKRDEEKQEKGKTWHRVERHYGEFHHMIRLGDDVDPENVNAEYKDGVLRIIVRKTKESHTKQHHRQALTHHRRPRPFRQSGHLHEGRLFEDIEAVSVVTPMFGMFKNAIL